MQTPQGGPAPAPRNHAHPPAFTVSLPPARPDRAQGLRGDRARLWRHRWPLRSANMCRGPASSAPGHRSGRRGPKSSSHQSRPAGWEADGRRSGQDTGDVGRRPAPRRRRTAHAEANTQSDHGPSSAADGKPAKGPRQSPERRCLQRRAPRARRRGACARRRGPRSRGHPPRREKRGRPGGRRRGARWRDGVRGTRPSQTQRARRLLGFIMIYYNLL